MRPGPRPLCDPVQPTFQMEGRGNGPEAFFRATPQKTCRLPHPQEQRTARNAVRRSVASCRLSALPCPRPLWKLVATWLMPPPRFRSAYEKPSNTRVRKS